MSDKPKILAGLVLFLGLATFPIWYTLGSAASGSGDALPPELDPPTGAPQVFTADWSKVCDESKENIDAKRLQAAFTKWPEGAELIEDPLGGKWRIVDEETPYLVVRDEETVVVYDGRCVESRAWMAAQHMDLLIDWRDWVVRDGEREYPSEEHPAQSSQKPVVRPMSLTGTCMGCHQSRQGFCGKCHEYADVSPVRPLHFASRGNGRMRCWDCHVDPDKPSTQSEGD